MIVPFDESHIKSAATADTLCFSVPWSEDSLRLLLKEPYSGLVMLDGNGRFAAYGGLLCVAGEAELLNLATLPEFRRRGYARELLHALYLSASAHGAASVTLEVRESNAGARALYLSEGFVEIGIRKNYYFKPCESAIIMEKKL